VVVTTTTMNILSKEIIKIYRNDIWKLHEVPRKIPSNKEFQFTSRFMEELMKVLGIKRILSTTYHPQSDG